MLMGATLDSIPGTLLFSKNFGFHSFILVSLNAFPILATAFEVLFVDSFLFESHIFALEWQVESNRVHMIALYNRDNGYAS